jgi:DNA-binding response OmpR family regulator
MRVLIVEDNLALARNLASALGKKGWAVEIASGGDDGDAWLTTQRYDLVILDLGLPDIDGLEVLRRLRQRNSRAPVLILTARDALQDRVSGLNMGADDYLTKPFELAELEARAGALIRRGTGGTSAVLTQGRLSFDTASRVLRIDDEILVLPRRELNLLEMLLTRRDQVVSKEALLEGLFGYDEDVAPNAVETYVHRLRKKLEPAGVHIRTIRGIGYLLERP